MKKFLSLLIIGLTMQMSLSAQDFVLNNPVMTPNPGVFPGGLQTISFDFYVAGAAYTLSSNDLSNDYATITFSFTKMNPTATPPTGTGANLFTWVLTNNGGSGSGLVYTWTGRSKNITVNQTPAQPKYKITFAGIPVTSFASQSQSDVRVAGQFTDPGNAPTGNAGNNSAVIATYTLVPTCNGPQLYMHPDTRLPAENYGSFEAGANNFGYWTGGGETHNWKAGTELAAANFGVSSSPSNVNGSFAVYAAVSDANMMVVSQPAAGMAIWYLTDTCKKIGNTQYYFRKGTQSPFTAYFAKVNNGTDPMIRIKIYDADNPALVFGSVDATITGVAGAWTQVALNNWTTTGGTDPNITATKNIRYDIISLNGVPFSMDGLCGFIPPAAPAPILLLDFTATKQGAAVQLSWHTSSEINSDHFEVEWSKNGSSWSNIGNVAAAGFSSTTKSYGLLHPNPVSGANYYRLK